MDIEDLAIMLKTNATNVERIQLSNDWTEVSFFIGGAEYKVSRSEFVNWFRKLFEDDGFGKYGSPDRCALNEEKIKRGWLVPYNEKKEMCPVTKLTFHERKVAMNEGNYFSGEPSTKQEYISLNLQYCHVDMPGNIRSSSIDVRLDWYFDPQNYSLKCRGANSLDSRKSSIKANLSPKAIVMLGCDALWPLKSRFE